MALDTSKTNWDLSPLAAGDDDPLLAQQRPDILAAANSFIAKWQPRNDYLQDPAALKQALDEYNAWQHAYGTDGKEGYYYWLRSTQDENDAAIKAAVQKVTDFAQDILNRIQFFELKVAKIDPQIQTKMLAAEDLADYRHFLTRLFAQARHQLSEAEERIMNLKATTSYSNWVRLTSGFIAKAEREVLLEDGSRQPQTSEQLQTLCTSADKSVRDEAGAALDDIFAANADIAEAELNSILANKKVDDELRGFDRPDASRHLSDDVDPAMVDALIQTVSAQEELAVRYYQLKAKLLGQAKLRYHERGVEYSTIKRQFDWPAGCELVHSVVSKLDPEFGQIFAGFLANGQIDVYPRKGKAGGAFCAYNLTSQPTYLLLNYTDKLRDVTTLAHELGHGINDELMKAQQNALNFGTSMATAEVASQFLEDFVLDEIASQADDQERLAIQMNRLNDAVSSIFRQIACYRFEQAIHQAFRASGYLSKDDINQLFQREMRQYMGEAAEGCDNWWVYWSHIRNFFYVYSYAGGLLIAKAMQAQVRQDARFIGKIKDFLATGRADSPAGTFAKMGLDIAQPEFWQQGLSGVADMLADTEALARKLGKI